MHHTPDPDPPRLYAEWIRPVADDLSRLDVPLDLTQWTLILLDATEFDHGPTPRAGWDGTWLYLAWGAGDRSLRLDVSGPTPTPLCCWNRSGPGVCDLARPLRSDHAACLRDLLSWLLRGEQVLFHPASQTRRKWWKP